MGPQSGAAMQVCLHKRCAFMQLLIKTTNVMTNFVCKIYMYIWYVCMYKSVFNFALCHCLSKLAASPYGPPSNNCLLHDFAYEKSFRCFYGSHAHYRQKPNCMPRADYLYPRIRNIEGISLYLGSLYYI